MTSVIYISKQQKKMLQKRHPVMKWNNNKNLFSQISEVLELSVLLQIWIVDVASPLCFQQANEPWDTKELISTERLPVKDITV